MSLPRLGPLHPPLPRGRIGIGQQPLRQLLGQRMAKGGVLGQKIKLEGALSHRARQQHPRFIGHQGCGVLLPQCQAGRAHQGQQVIARGSFTQHLIQAVSHPEGVAVDGLHGLEHQPIRSSQQPGHVTHVFPRQLLENLDGQRFSHERLQSFACPVPVNHEHDARRRHLQRLPEPTLVTRAQPRVPDLIWLAGVE